MSDVEKKLKEIKSQLDLIERKIDDLDRSLGRTLTDIDSNISSLKAKIKR